MSSLGSTTAATPRLLVADEVGGATEVVVNELAEDHRYEVFEVRTCTGVSMRRRRARPAPWRSESR